VVDGVDDLRMTHRRVEHLLDGALYARPDRRVFRCVGV
jgi:hypothetical protein